MSTYLQICQDLANDIGIYGGYPSAVTSQTGRLGDIVRWVRDAWTSVQNRRTDWRWLHHGFTLTTSADDDTYTFGDCTDSTTSSAITRFRRWDIQNDEDRPRIYLSDTGVSGETFMTYLSWNDWRRIYRIQSPASAYPAFLSYDDQNQLLVGPPPNDTYVITAKYWRSAQVLAADGDEPECPSVFHDLIRYRALELYAGRFAAPEVMNKAVIEGRRLTIQLEEDQLPEMLIGEPMA